MENWHLSPHRFLGKNGGRTKKIYIWCTFQAFLQFFCLLTFDVESVFFWVPFGRCCCCCCTQPESLHHLFGCWSKKNNEYQRVRSEKILGKRADVCCLYCSEKENIVQGALIFLISFFLLLLNSTDQMVKLNVDNKKMFFKTPCIGVWSELERSVRRDLSAPDD